MVFCFVPCSQCEVSSVYSSQKIIHLRYVSMSLLNDGRRGFCFLDRKLPSLRNKAKTWAVIFELLIKIQTIIKDKQFLYFVFPHLT